jgi:uncharacterized protein (TIGR02246 family)
VDDRCEALWAIEQIKQLKARYFRTMDRKDWEGFAEVFASDAVAGTGAAALHGREQIVAGVAAIAESARTVHHGHMPEIEVTGDGTARGTWAMHDHFVELAGDPPKGFTGYGHYHDTYAIEDGRWRIASTVLTRLRIDAHPGGLPDLYARLYARRAG